ncbi:hypothetical protein ME121_3107 [Methylobacterium sp. ME121]|nr:hypothetical protein ME121_3107 [Methylobacterium sp. ME121]
MPDSGTDEEAAASRAPRMRARSKTRPGSRSGTRRKVTNGIGVGAGSIPGSSQAAPGISVAAAIEHRARDEVGRGREVCDVEDRATPARWRRGRSIHFASRTAREACPTGHWMI